MSTISPTPASEDPRVERTRQAVVDAGMAVLLGGGPDGITHAGIAAAAGVSRTTLYKYWPTRAKLLFEILAAFDGHPAHASSGDLRADLLMLLHELQVSMSDPNHRRVFSSMLAQAQWDDDVSEAQNSLRAIPLAGLEVLFAAAAERGEIEAGIVAMNAAGRLIGPLMFAALVGDQDLMTVDIDSIVDDWLATVLQ
ncbi:MAG: TetR/AcrR family transcriptional regulator [Ilumatobacter sp.]